MNIPSDAFTVLDFYFELVQSLWSQIIVNNWLLSLSFLITFVSFGIFVFISIFKKGD